MMILSTDAPMFKKWSCLLKFVYIMRPGYMLKKPADDLRLLISLDAFEVGCWMDIDISPIPHRSK